MRPKASDSGFTPLEERISRYLATRHLLDGIKRLGLAVSGGSDSVALMNLLPPLCARVGIVPVVLNFDHGIPGEHSDEDAAFVRDACARLGLDFIGGQGADIRPRDGRSLEMVAREQRLAFYRQCAVRRNLDAIATGHQANDVAETLVLRLLRGAGAGGLSGMKPLSVLPPTAQGGRELRIIRPLLNFTRDDLRAWLTARGIAWREDPSNTNEAIQRNEIRRSILPALARRGEGLPKAIAQLTQSADILREEDEFLDALSRQWLADHQAPDGALPLSLLRADLHLAMQRRVLRLWLLGSVGAAASGYSEVRDLLSVADGDVVTLPGSVRVACDGGLLRVCRDGVSASAPPEMQLSVGGEVEWGGYRISVAPSRSVIRARGVMGEWPAACTLSLEAVGSGVLSVRGRRAGDRMAPFGLKGTKKLQDIFTDAKVPEALRDSYPVIVCNGEVVWIPGYRIAGKFAVRDNDVSLRIVVFPLSNSLFPKSLC